MPKEGGDIPPDYFRLKNVQKDRCLRSIEAIISELERGLGSVRSMVTQCWNGYLHDRAQIPWEEAAQRFRARRRLFAREFETAEAFDQMAGDLADGGVPLPSDRSYALGEIWTDAAVRGD